MDVTEEILLQNIVYGSSDNTDPASLVSSRSLNYATGPSIHRPDKARIELIPYSLHFADAVGPFGVDNYFCKVTVNLDLRYALKCFEEPSWECAQINGKNDDPTDYEQGWNQANIDVLLDPVPVNSYDPSRLSVALSRKADAYVSIDLDNLKTGNQYIDNWLDMRLYTSERQMHPFNRMYIRSQDFFYVGIAARNSRRLPYNIKCTVGTDYIAGDAMTADQRQYIAKNLL